MVIHHDDDAGMFPEALKSWLQTPIFEQEINRRCKVHTSKYESKYCYVCKGEHVCEKCWDKLTDEHKDHISSYLQVYACTRRTSIHVDDMKKHWDVSQIQVYKLNARDVVYLDTDEVMTISKGKKKKEKGNCEACCKQLHNPSKYRFCSITCKKKMMECSMGKAEEQHSRQPLNRKRSIGSNDKIEEYSIPVILELSKEKVEEHDSVPMLLENHQVLSVILEVVNNISKRKRRRKQINPQRSPLK